MKPNVSPRSPERITLLVDPTKKAAFLEMLKLLDFVEVEFLQTQEKQFVENAKENATPTDTFEHLFPYLYRWVDLGNEVRLGQDAMYYSTSLVQCFDEGGTIYQSPSDIDNIEEALQLADAAIHDWMEENMPDELL